MRRLPVLVLPAVLALALSALPTPAAPKQGRQHLAFIPQETVGSSLPVVSPALGEVPLRLALADGRDFKDPRTIGEGTDDEDRAFPIFSHEEVLPFVEEHVRAVLSDWDLKLVEEGGTPLALTLKRFFVAERNQAVGATYQADVSFWWEAASGASGAVSGSATRYGKKFSADNRNEVLSDALKNALRNLVGHPPLQKAITGKEAPAPAPGPTPSSAPSAASEDEGALTPEQRLKRLEELKDKGLITREEYEAKRAEILKEL